MYRTSQPYLLVLCLHVLSYPIVDSPHGPPSLTLILLVSSADIFSTDLHFALPQLIAVFLLADSDSAVISGLNTLLGHA